MFPGKRIFEHATRKRKRGKTTKGTRTSSILLFSGVSNADKGTKKKKETEKGRQKSGGKKCQNSPMSHSPSTFTCPQVGLSAGHVGLSRPNTCVTKMAKITITIATVFFLHHFFVTQAGRQAGRHAPYTCRRRSALQSPHVAQGPIHE